MKGKYWRNSFIHIRRQKEESLILFLIFFFLSFLLAILFFFSYSEEMERQLVSGMHLRYEFDNHHFFSTDAAFSRTTLSQDNPEEMRDYFQSMIAWLDELVTEETVHYHNYNLVSYVSSGNSNQRMITAEHFVLGTARLFGIADEEYAKENSLLLLMGRMPTEQELIEGAAVVVVSDQAVFLEEGVIRDIALGDVIFVTLNEQQEEEKLEVIGIYQNRYQYDYSYGEKDSFLNSNGYLVPNTWLYNIIEQKAQFDYGTVNINRIVYQCESLADYLKFKDELDIALIKFQTECRQKNYYAPKLELMKQDVDTILASVARIKGIYRIIFLLSFVLVAGFTVSFLIYILNRKQKEIAIYVSLGDSKKNILLRYILRYTLLALFALAAGICFAYMVSSLLSSSIVQKNLVLRNNLLRYSHSGILLETEDTAFRYTLSIKSIIITVIQVATISLAVIGLAVCYTIHKILKSDLRKILGGN